MFVGKYFLFRHKEFKYTYNQAKMHLPVKDLDEVMGKVVDSLHFWNSIAKIYRLRQRLHSVQPHCKQEDEVGQS